MPCRGRGSRTVAVRQNPAVSRTGGIATLGVMRALSYILIALGFYLLASAFYDEYRGITTKPAIFPPKATSRNASRGYLFSIPVHREQNPELFHQFMVTHWIYAVTVEAGICLLYLKKKRANDL